MLLPLLFILDQYVHPSKCQLTSVETARCSVTMSTLLPASTMMMLDEACCLSSFTQLTALLNVFCNTSKDIDTVRFN